MLTSRRAAGIVAAAVSLACAGSIDAGGQRTAPAPGVSYRFPDIDRPALLSRAFPEIDRLFRAFAEASRVPGIAYGVLVDGQLVHTGAFGYRELAARSRVDADTVFRIASMTKSFTAVAVMRLRDEGRLSLDDPAERYVPELASLPYPTADSPPITIRHLLSHAEGFPEDNPWGDQQLAATDEEMSRMIRAGIPFSTAPGTAFEYSNFGFAILGRIVSRASGVSYADYVAAHILKPLGMTATTLGPASVPPERLAHGYRWEDATWKEEPPLPDGAFGSMGGMLTSTRDLARYVGFLMDAWPPRDDPETGPVRRSSLREMQQVWRPFPASARRETIEGPIRLNTGGYGFGLRVWQTCSLPHVVAHSGGLPGFGSHMRWLPEHGVAIIAMGNLTYTSWGRVADEAIEALDRTGGLKPRVPQPSAALIGARAAVSRLIDRWDDGLADAIAADNLFLDESKDRRRAFLAGIRATHGTCRSDANAFDVENALRGTWKMTCDRGWLDVGITLAPTTPALVQSLTVRPVMPMNDKLAAAEARVRAALVPAAWPALAEILDAGMDADLLAARLKTAAAWGACRPGETVAGDGTRFANVRWTCTRGTLDLVVTIDAGTGKLQRVSLVPVANGACSQ